MILTLPCGVAPSNIMKKSLKLSLILLVLLPLGAQAQVFMRPFDNAANMGLGGATVALSQPENGITNAAQLGNAPRLGVMAWSAVPYGLTGWQSLGFQTLGQLNKKSGIGLEILHSGIEGYREQRLQLMYGRKLGAKFSLGGHLLAMRVSADEYGSRNIVSAAVGITAQPLPQLTLGAMIQNPVPQDINDDIISNLVRIGATWQPSKLFLVTSEIRKDLERPVQLCMGAEYRPVPLFRLRAGMRTYPARTSFGAGLALKNGLRLDFGSEWHPVLGFTPGGMVAWVID